MKKTIVQIINDTDWAMRRLHMSEVKYNNKTVCSTRSSFDPEPGDILKIGQQEYMFDTGRWLRVHNEHNKTIEALQKISCLNNNFHHSLSEVEISQNILVIESELSSLRVQLRKRKRQLESDLQGMRGKFNKSHYELAVEALLTYIDDPSIRSLVQ